ncbi:helix-turn-helix transcriptional regulator [uncultured Endozoicomonas sp.]|uniref:helix-turn-helix domain-containing protein n=1 Tax=uncultured Endozoicomonas sp. TaxID=432652 RepID=UPI00343928DA
MTRKKISERRIAKSLDVSQPAVHKWVYGKALPRLDKFCQLCVILDTSPNELLGWKT